MDLPNEEKEKYLDAICDELCPSVEVSEEGPVRRRTTRVISKAYAKILDPYRDAPYPLDRAGTILRVTKEFLHNFVNFPKLAKLLRDNSENETVQGMLKDGKLSELARLELIMEASYRIGTASYTPEWREEAAIERLDFYDETIQGVEKANEFITKLLLGHLYNAIFPRTDPVFQKHDARKQITVLDVGAGKGGTIIPFIDKIKQLAESDGIKYHERVRVVSLDICRHALEYTREKLQELIPEENITGIVSNFGQLFGNEELKRYFEKVDIIVSGGSIMHNTDKQPFFNFMYKLLRPGGVMQIWDWSGGYSWAARTLRLAEDGKRKFRYESVSGKPLHVLAEGEALSFSEQQILSEIEYKVIFEILPRDIVPIEENLIDTWLGAKRKRDRETDAFVVESGFGYTDDNYPEHSAQFKLDFERAIKSKEGFNFLEYLRDNVSTLTPPPKEERTPYFFIEGYGPAKLYEAYMNNAGFKGAKYKYFTEVYNELDTSGLSADAIAAAHTLFFAKGTK